MNDSKFDLILNELTKLNDRVGGLESKVDEVVAKSDAIMEQVAKNAENITEIQGNQKVIGEIIKRQEDTINVLARRSIDQESQIKTVK